MQRAEKDKIRQILNEEWYIQGVSAIPIFIVFCGLSAYQMKDKLGYGYTQNILKFRRGYGEMGYWWPDLRRLWQIIKNKQSEDKTYLAGIKAEYEKIVERNERFLGSLDQDKLVQLNDDELLAVFKKCLSIQTDSVGLAHVVEPIGIEGEKEFKQQLVEELGSDMAKKQYVALTAPSQLSFVSQEEADLRRIASYSNSQKEKLLKDHRQKYFWIQNSYREPKQLKVEDFAKRLEKSAGEKKNKEQPINKQTLMDNLKLSQSTRDFIELIDFTTAWQDERKRNLLVVISYLGLVIDEIAKRTKMLATNLYHLTFSDIPKIESLRDIKNLQAELDRRFDGVLLCWRSGLETVVSGNDYAELVETSAGVDKKVKVGDQIYGSVANSGTAVGSVVVCRNLSELHKVQAGDILVASMTRPEFMPALKKAAAIVTDEGGITSHAAIVSRELGIPAVIGTKVATKVLKDGMRVEVGANHGFVRILKG